MTTRVYRAGPDQSGDLVRLDHGEPVVRFDGDRTEYRITWRGLSVLSSDEYLLPEGLFQEGLFVDAQGDVWRRKAVTDWGTPWPCEEGREHLHGGKGTLCWHCSQRADTGLSYELFTLVSAEGFPAESARPQRREEIEEWTGGALLPVGSPEARARSHAQRAMASVDRSSVIALGWGVGTLVALIVAVVVLAVVHAL